MPFRIDPIWYLFLLFHGEQAIPQFAWGFRLSIGAKSIEGHGF